MRPEGAEGDRSKPAITLGKCVSGENLYASFHARRMPADSAERHSSCVHVFVKLQDTSHQNPSNRGSVGLSSCRNSALRRTWASIHNWCVINTELIVSQISKQTASNKSMCMDIRNFHFFP